LASRPGRIVGSCRDESMLNGQEATTIEQEEANDGQDSTDPARQRPDAAGARERPEGPRLLRQGPWSGRGAAANRPRATATRLVQCGWARNRRRVALFCR